jgi:MoaA/NifB/PqqE/SkfB family radical SAM enzyme
VSWEPASEPRFLVLTVKCHFDDLSQSLTVERGDDAPPVTVALPHGWSQVSVEVAPGASGVRLSTDRLLPAAAHPGDARDLGVQVRQPVLHADPTLHAQSVKEHAARVENARRMLESPAGAFLVTARDLRYVSGFYAAEMDEGLPFRWMASSGQLGLPAADTPRFIELWVGSRYADGSQVVTLTAGQTSSVHALTVGWNAISTPVGPGVDTVRLTVNKGLPRKDHPLDPRPLAVQVRTPLLHADAARHTHVSRQHENRVANLHELRAGAIELSSLPPKLGIDITGTCNVKPPCVYCQWDQAKDMEGDNVSLPFNPTTVREYGDFFENAHDLVNCSIGEPFMVKSIDLLLDIFGSQGKLLELTSNGQILTDLNIRKLLGRNIHLYVSLDAATPETYAKLRNDTFPKLLANLRRLIEAKGGPGRLPLLYAVFMPMRANVHEVDAFVDICAQLGVDRLVLRPLNPSPGVTLKWDRAGYHFDYQQELLPFEELVRISGRVAELCRRKGVALSDQMDFGGEMGPRFREAYEQGRREGEAAVLAAPAPQFEEPLSAPSPSLPEPAHHAPEPTTIAASESADETEEPEASRDVQLPVCTEPWTSLYILRRGTFPCCYGGAAIAPMDDFKQAWNSRIMLDIRRELQAGRFHRYCFDSPDCPIVRKADQAQDLPVSQHALMMSRRMREQMRRTGYGVPGKLYRLAKHYGKLVRGRVRRMVR